MNRERRIIVQSIFAGAGLLFLNSSPFAPIARAAESMTTTKLFLPRRRLGNKILECPIYYFHQIGDQGSFERFIAPKLENTPDGNYFPVAIRDLAAWFYDGIQVWPEGKRPMAMTFDDSLISQSDNAVPILEKWKLRATFFALTDYQDGDHTYISPARLRQIPSKAGKWQLMDSTDMNLYLYFTRKALQLGEKISPMLKTDLKT